MGLPSELPSLLITRHRGRVGDFGEDVAEVFETATAGGAGGSAVGAASL